MPAYPTLIMLPPRGEHPAERWMADARTAAAIDLWTRLSQIDIAALLVDAADTEDQATFRELGADLAPALTGPFHFAQRVSRLCDDNRWERLAYFGGASVPLLTPEVISGIFDQAAELGAEAGVVNNLHSTDWMVVNDTRAWSRLIDRLPKDNMLGWVLSHDAGFDIRSMPSETIFRADLDTPADVLMIGDHALAGPRLKAFAGSSGGALAETIERLRTSIGTPGTGLAVIGRASARLWTRLETELSIWVRSYVEERGMVASGRLDQGKVHSLVGEAVERWGPEQFVNLLGKLVDAAAWDTRVWMAHRGAWPPQSDRWAADLGWPDLIEDDALRALTRAVTDAKFPIVTGGQGVVGGSMMALLDGLAESGSGYQPSR
jgi:hypothetical protein